MFGICIVKLSPVGILLVVNNTTVSYWGKRWQLSNSFLTEYWCCCSLLDSLTFSGIFLLSAELCHAPRKRTLYSFLFWAAFLLGQGHYDHIQCLWCKTQPSVLVCCGLLREGLSWRSYPQFSFTADGVKLICCSLWKSVSLYFVFLIVMAIAL